MPGENKCAHEGCACTVSNKKYCSDYCEEADKQDITEIHCDCGHPNCA